MKTSLAVREACVFKGGTGTDVLVEASNVVPKSIK